MAAVYPSYQSVFVPDHDATNKLTVDFARNINKFPVNKYTQILPVKKTQGLYLRMTIEEAARIINTGLDNFVWPDGMVRPEGWEGHESHEWLMYQTIRRAWNVPLGNLTIGNASWDIVAQYSRIKAHQAMVARTQLVVTALTTEANYDATHVLDVTSDIAGNSGAWEYSTTHRQDIKRSIQYAVELILADTLNAVTIDDLQLVIPSKLASRMSLTQEIVDYIKGSPEALAQIRGELPGGNVAHGLPERIYGVKIVVEDTYKVTTKKGQTTSRSQIFPIGNAALVARPGGLEGVANTPNFSTVVLFAKEELTVEKLDDRNNRRVQVSIVEDLSANVIAPASGVLFTDCAS